MDSCHTSIVGHMGVFFLRVPLCVVSIQREPGGKTVAPFGGVQILLIVSKLARCVVLPWLPFRLCGSTLNPRGARIGAALCPNSVPSPQLLTVSK